MLRSVAEAPSQALAVLKAVSISLMLAVNWLQEANAQHQQQLQELEHRQREMQADLVEKAGLIQQLQEQLEEQEAAARKAAIEYEQKIGAMNREFEKMLSLTMGKLKILLQNDEWMAIKARAAATKVTVSDA